MYAPLVYLHPDEEYKPMSAEKFIASSSLRWCHDQGGKDCEVVKQGKIDAARLGTMGKAPARQYTMCTGLSASSFTGFSMHTTHSRMACGHKNMWATGRTLRFAWTGRTVPVQLRITPTVSHRWLNGETFLNMNPTYCIQRPRVSCVIPQYRIKVSY
jgi:hypothetical protein